MPPSSRLARALALVAAVAVVGDPRRAVAEPAPPRPLSPEERPPPDPGWQNGARRWFSAGLIDIGPLYFRPRLSAGFGRPFHEWVGVDTNPLISGEGIGAYAGLRGMLPHLDLRAGARYFSTFSRSFLEPREHYNRLALEVRSGPAANYLTLEAELTASVPAGPGNLLVVLTGDYVTLVEPGYWVYEDVLRVIAEPPWIWQARTGYELVFGRTGRGRLAMVAEAVGSPGRGTVVLRAGLTGAFRLGDILELRGALVPAWVSEDSLGAMGGQWFEIGLRFRFATGAPAPLFLPSLT